MGRLFKTAALAAAAYGIWTWLKGQLDDAEVGDSPPPRAMPARPPVQKAAPDPKPKAANGSATKAELYERATQLGITGRSKMSKAELERAIRDAG